MHVTNRKSLPPHRVPRYLTQHWASQSHRGSTVTPLGWWNQRHRLNAAVQTSWTQTWNMVNHYETDARLQLMPSSTAFESPVSSFRATKNCELKQINLAIWIGYIFGCRIKPHTSLINKGSEKKKIGINLQWKRKCIQNTLRTKQCATHTRQYWASKCASSEADGWHRDLTRRGPSRESDCLTVSCGAWAWHRYRGWDQSLRNPRSETR